MPKVKSKKENIGIKIVKIEKQLNNFSNKQDELIKKVDMLSDDVKSLYARLQLLDEIQLKNGNGRIIKMLRDEFYQMIYDKTQVRYVFEKAKNLITILLTILLVTNLILTIFFR